ncbi:hypothetical protein HYZ70_00975 [Candidatus Curtissbacteria bacterium]|nr:hypothetical protein [Candidatus Curtissbacteria bacterium]
MTNQQWEDHKVHLTEHFPWPATGKAIKEACNGEDVTPEVLKEVKEMLDDEKKYTLDEVKKILVKEEKE